MSLDLKRQLIAQLVESSRLLRNYIDHRAKGRGTTRAQWIVLFRLRRAGGIVAGRSRRRARIAADLAGAPARPAGRARPARAAARSQGSARQPAVSDGERPPACRRSRQPARLHCDRCAAGYSGRGDRRPASRRSATSRTGSRALPSRRATSRPSNGLAAIAEVLRSSAKVMRFSRFALRDSLRALSITRALAASVANAHVSCLERFQTED